MIYTGAEKTILIKDGHGLRDCCALASCLSNLEDWTSNGEVRLLKHINDVHRHDFREGVSERLWPLQEVMLSSRLQIVSCNARNANREHLSGQKSAYPSDSCIRDLYQFALTWVSIQQDVILPSKAYNEKAFEFIKALVTNGFVVRWRPVRKEGRVLKGVFALHSSSIRVTSKPRDFILALFIQYKWYTVPRSAKDMNFSALFRDAYEQAADAGFAWEPLLLGGMLDGSGST